jgi:hypothetical protein
LATAKLTRAFPSSPFSGLASAGVGIKGVADKNPTAAVMTVGDEATSVKGIFQQQAKTVANLCHASRPDLTVRPSALRASCMVAEKKTRNAIFVSYQPFIARVASNCRSPSSAHPLARNASDVRSMSDLFLTRTGCRFEEDLRGCARGQIRQGIG